MLRRVFFSGGGVEGYGKRATWSCRGTVVLGHMLCQVYTVGVAELFLGGNVRTQRVLMRFTSYKFKNYVEKWRLRALLIIYVACRRRGEGQLLDDAGGRLLECSPRAPAGVERGVTRHVFAFKWDEKLHFFCFRVTVG